MYKIIGGDGREYGPVTVEQLREWINAGRADENTQVQKEGEADWKPLSAFTEFTDALAAGRKPPPPQLPPPEPTFTLAADPAALANAALARCPGIDIGACLSRAWALLTSDFWPIVGVTAVVFLVLAAANMFYVGIVVNGPLVGGLFWYYLKRIRNQPAEIGDAFAGFSLAFLQLFLGVLVSGLLVGVGFMFCLIPGIYLAIAWHLTMPIIIDKRIGFWEAMETSRRVLTQHWWTAFLFAIVCWLINFGGVLLCGIGFFVTWPLTMLAWTYLYEDFFGTAKSPSV